MTGSGSNRSTPCWPAAPRIPAEYSYFTAFLWTCSVALCFFCPFFPVPAAFIEDALHAENAGVASLTNLISRRHPRAWAYLCNVAREGECFPWPDSKRAIADCVVPIRFAASACVIPDSALAFKNSSRNENSPSRRSYSAFTSGRFNAFALSSLCVSISYLLHPPLCGGKLLQGCFISLFYKLMKHYNLFTDQCTVKYPGDAFCCH